MTDLTLVNTYLDDLKQMRKTVKSLLKFNCILSDCEFLDYCEDGVTPLEVSYCEFLNEINKEINRVEKP